MEAGWGLKGLEAMWKEYEADVFPHLAKLAVTKFGSAIDYGQLAIGRSNLPTRTIKSLVTELEKMRELEAKINVKGLLGKRPTV